MARIDFEPIKGVKTLFKVGDEITQDSIDKDGPNKCERIHLPSDLVVELLRTLRDNQELVGVSDVKMMGFHVSILN